MHYNISVVFDDRIREEATRARQCLQRCNSPLLKCFGDEDIYVLRWLAVKRIGASCFACFHEAADYSL